MSKASDAFEPLISHWNALRRPSANLVASTVPTAPFSNVTAASSASSTCRSGTKGSLAFDMERLNELQVFRADGDRARGFKTVLVSEADHPFWEHWWPPGHIIGWGDTFVHELHHFLEAVAGEHGVAPYGADFEDGYRASEVCEAIVRSGETGQREAVSYRSH